MVAEAKSPEEAANAAIIITQHGDAQRRQVIRNQLEGLERGNRREGLIPILPARAGDQHNSGGGGPSPGGKLSVPASVTSPFWISTSTVA